MNLLRQLIPKFTNRNLLYLLVSIIFFTLLIRPSIIGKTFNDTRMQSTVSKMQVIQQETFTPVRIKTGKLTISGGGIPLPPKPPFPPVNIKTEKLTISGGGIPLPPKPPFPGITITTTKLTISGKPK
jgi:hypothetical protein